MPQIVAAALAKSAMAAPVVATTTAAAAPTIAATGTAAAQTAALELAKQKAIQASMQQMAAQGAKQATAEAVKQQVGTEVAKQVGAEATKQSAVEASKQGIAQGFQKVIPQAADDAASLATQGAGSSAYGPASTPFPSYGAMPPATPLPPAGSIPPTGGGTPLAFKEAAGLGNAPPAPELTQHLLPKAPFKDPGTLNRVMSDQSLSKLTTTPADELMGIKETTFPLAPKSALAQGFETAMQYAKENPVSTGLGLMAVGQYMNQPDQPEKKQYKNTVDMSGFEPSVASVQPFTPSYEYQKYAAEGGLMKYAVGGPVETMSAQNAVGGNMMYPQAGLQTALYSNPMVQRPEAVNVVSPGEGPAVGAYSGEQKFADGGISEEVAKEYGLKTRKQRALKGLSSSYEEMSKEREKDLANLKAMGDKFDEGIIRRSRTQELSSPFSAAMTEHARLAKKNKVPVAEMPKTSLGDIDNYMDTPIEAASGGIMGNLGSYSDGGRLLRGPGDGVSDSIPAVIGKRQPARLADGEFVIPARIVSELGNGSTEAGARKLYAMMERIQSTRKKSIGKKKVAVNSKADKHLPA